ncbi:MAG: DUF1203 domain-containing protein [Pseudomonadota bacterium]
MPHLYTPIDTKTVRAFQAGGLDANGQRPERAVSDGEGMPCRHCLRNIPKGRGMLILAHRPFPAPQPYAETGPIFLCADPCDPWEGPGVPPILTSSPEYLIKGYTSDDRIRYGTGAVVPATALDDEIARRLSDPEIAFVDVRSARNNCFQCRAVRKAADTATL